MSSFLSSSGYFSFSHTQSRWHEGLNLKLLVCKLMLFFIEFRPRWHIFCSLILKNVSNSISKKLLNMVSKVKILLGKSHRHQHIYIVFNIPVQILFHLGPTCLENVDFFYTLDYCSLCFGMRFRDRVLCLKNPCILFMWFPILMYICLSNRGKLWLGARCPHAIISNSVHIFLL